MSGGVTVNPILFADLPAATLPVAAGSMALVVQDGLAKRVLVSDLVPAAATTFKMTDEAGAVAMPYVRKLRQSLFFGDRKDNITGNGTSNDTAAVQDDIDYAAANNLPLYFPSGMKLMTTAPLICGKWTRIEGRGGVLMKDNGVPNALGEWTGFHFNHLGVGLDASSVDINSWDRCDLSNFLIVRPQPTPVAGQTWTPNAADADILLAGTSGRIEGVECLRSTNFIKIDRNVGHQVLIDKCKGQIFNTGVYVQCALDSVYLRSLHTWPYWTGGPSAAANPVLSYQCTAHVGLRTGRTDGLTVGDLFTYAARATHLIDYYGGGGNAALAGTLNNGTFNMMYNDNGANVVTAVAAATGFVMRGSLLMNYGGPSSINTTSFNGIDQGAPNSMLDVANYWSNNARNAHAAAIANGARINIQRFVEGGWDLADTNAASLIGINGGRIDVNDWQKIDVVTAPYSNPGIAGPRYNGKVFGKLSEGFIAATTNGAGLAFWPHNIGGQVPVHTRLFIQAGGAGGATQYVASGFDTNNVSFTFYDKAGNPVINRSDIIVKYECYALG